MDVQSLNLAGNEIDDYAMKYLAEALPEHLKQLRALNIGRTSITQQSVRTVAPALRKVCHTSHTGPVEDSFRSYMGC
eukprot:709109-Pyramimonas_sp.AAC.1